MYRHAIILMTLTAFLNLSMGCTHTVQIKKEEARVGYEKIVKLMTLDGTIVEFDHEGGRYLPMRNVIAGFARGTERYGQRATAETIVPLSIPADSVTQLWVQRSNPAGTVFAVIGIAAVVILAVGLIAVALKESCPFVYSYDGSRYVFDAEPLGGAICRGLQRAECSRLDYLKAADGEYRLMLRNEVDETQYLDAIRLLVVDHAPDQLIVPDTAGRLHVITQAAPLRAAVDENGRDITSFLRERDGAAWQTHLAGLSPTEADTRHHLTLTFPKPADAKRARLIVNAGTAIWGSNMIREMLQMRGDGVDGWYQEVDRRGPRLWELFSFNLREELYLMKLYVQRDTTLVERGMILGGGPFIAEDRVIEFDVSDLPGETLTIHLNPPKSFWTLDYMAVEYDRDSVATAQALDIVRGSDQDGADIAGPLRQSDGQYYVMPQKGNWAEVSFAALPPPGDNLERSIFLETDGYYEIQTDKSQPQQTELVQRMLNEPGAIAAYSIVRYLEWRQQAKLDR